LNSFSTPIGYFLVTDEVDERSVNQQIAFCSNQLPAVLASNRQRVVLRNSPIDLMCGGGQAFCGVLQTAFFSDTASFV
jgi:hypothetical protein